MNIGAFLQDQVLGMQWLSDLMGRGLSALGLDLANPWVGSLHFFLYDTVKILVLLCVLIFVISYIESYFPPERTKRMLGRVKGLPANILAALLGTVTPFCSCSSIPIFMGFLAAGLPLSATFSFLISSPMVDLGSLVLLISIFGWKVALLYVALGLVIAVLAGTFISKLRMEDQVADFIRYAVLPKSARGKPSVSDRLRGAWAKVRSTLKKVILYVFLGVGIGAIIHNWIPESFIVRLLGGGNPFGVVLATAAGIPMYADIFGTIPIAEALLAKGAKLGVALSFMMAVTTLSVPSLVLLKKAVKRRLFLTFLVICTAGIIAIGYVFNGIAPFLFQ